MNEERTFAEGALLMIVALLFHLFGALVLRDLWNWYMVATFALPPIGFAIAVGLWTARGLLIPGPSGSKAGTDWYAIVAQGLYYLLCWGFGAVFRA